jgi:hypothetical protein
MWEIIAVYFDNQTKLHYAGTTRRFFMLKQVAHVICNQRALKF